MEDAYGGAKEDRISAAARLTSQLDNSKIRNFQIQIYAKGKNCDIMHIRSLNLLPSMMEALATGSLIYGAAIPGGVNSFAKQNGFKTMLYTSRADDSFVSYGNSSLTGPEIDRMKACTASNSSTIQKAGSPDNDNAVIKGKRLVTKIHGQYKIHKFYAEANRQGTTCVFRRLRPADLRGLRPPFRCDCDQRNGDCDRVVARCGGYSVTGSVFKSRVEFFRRIESSPFMSSL